MRFEPRHLYEHLPVILWNERSGRVLPHIWCNLKPGSDRYLRNKSSCQMSGRTSPCLRFRRIFGNKRRRSSLAKAPGERHWMTLKHLPKTRKMAPCTQAYGKKVAKRQAFGKEESTTLQRAQALGSCSAKKPGLPNTAKIISNLILSYQAGLSQTCASTTRKNLGSRKHFRTWIARYTTSTTAPTAPESFSALALHRFWGTVCPGLRLKMPNARTFGTTTSTLLEIQYEDCLLWASSVLSIRGATQL